MENPPKVQTSVQKVLFSTLGQSHKKMKSFIFQFLVGLGVSVQIFMLGLFAIVNLKILGHSFLNIILNLP